MLLNGYTNDLRRSPQRFIILMHSSSSRRTRSRFEVVSEKSMWLNECDPISCFTRLERIRRIKSGAYQAGSVPKAVQGSCLYQSPSHRSFFGGLGISAWARPEALRSHLSRNKCPTVAKVIGMDSSSRIFARMGTFLRQVVARSVLSSTLRPRNAQAISKSAEIVAEAKAPPRNGLISTPSKLRTGGQTPGVKFPLKSKMDFRIECFKTVVMDLKPNYRFAAWICRQLDPADLGQPTSDPSTGFRARNNPRRASMA